MGDDVVARAQAGDLEAFEELLGESYPRLYRLAFGILRDADRAEDATQSTLLEIWRHLRWLRDAEAYASWSYRILVRACSREARAAPRWMPDSALGPQPDTRAVAALRAVAVRDELERGFRRISVDHRAVIVLRYLFDMPTDEIAEALGIPPGTVASRLNRAMGALRAALEAEARPVSPRLEPREAER